MSNIRQNETPSRREAGCTENSNTPHVTQPQPTNTTPAKKKHGPDLAWASALEKYDQTHFHLGKEMEGRWLGAMPVNEFFEKFLPPPQNVPLPHVPKNAFDNVKKGGVEKAIYNPFIEVIQEWIPHLEAINSSTKLDTANSIRLKTDISIYNRVQGVPPPDRTNFAQLELWIEFKGENVDVAFQDPEDIEDEKSRQRAIDSCSFTPATLDGYKSRGQLASHAGALHSEQFRHFSFSVLVEGDSARFLRWDPTGTIVTIAFNFQEKPEPLAEFLWRFNYLSAKDRGHDQSVQATNLAPEVDARVREKLSIADGHTPLYRYELPGLERMGYAYGPKPRTVNRSLVSRCTRSQPVVWIPTMAEPCANPESAGGDLRPDSGYSAAEKKGPWLEERIVFMKDTWRFLPTRSNTQVMAEHEIYKILHDAKTPNIPEHVTGGDVDGGNTQTQGFLGASWSCVKPRISPYRHYRLVLGIVGRTLFKFECTKQLVTAVFDALQAHSHAFKEAKLLHRDISGGNIITTDDGKGLLIDWEMAKMVDEVGSRQHDRTGTWQFMSAILLQNSRKVHTHADDLESFLHVLAWMTLRYVPAIDGYDITHPRTDMAMFDEHHWSMEDREEGGKAKSDALGAGSYPSRKFRPRQDTPLHELLEDLSAPFQSLYGRKPKRPTEEYNNNIKSLESSNFFLKTMGEALDKDVWPTNDKADENLLVAPANYVKERPALLVTFFRTQNTTRAESIGVSTESKRGASPTPETSSKRRRGTPTVSEILG